MQNKTIAYFLAYITHSVIDIRKVQYLSPNCGGVEVKDRYHHTTTILQSQCPILWTQNMVDSFLSSAQEQEDSSLHFLLFCLHTIMLNGSLFVEVKRGSWSPQEACSGLQSAMTTIGYFPHPHPHFQGPGLVDTGIGRVHILFLNFHTQIYHDYNPCIWYKEKRVTYPVSLVVHLK